MQRAVLNALKTLYQANESNLNQWIECMKYAMTEEEIRKCDRHVKEYKARSAELKIEIEKLKQEKH